MKYILRLSEVKAFGDLYARSPDVVGSCIIRYRARFGEAPSDVSEMTLNPNISSHIMASVMMGYSSCAAIPAVVNCANGNFKLMKIPRMRRTSICVARLGLFDASSA